MSVRAESTDTGSVLPLVYVIDSDPAVRSGLATLICALDVDVATCASAEEFFDALDPLRAACVVTEAHLPGMSGTQLQQELAARHLNVGVIMIAADSDVPLAVRAMRHGAIDFIEKPFVEGVLLRRIRQAIARRHREG